tara:strand:- start:98 stop:1624 length:1527 start_codon:yes stop_codon:yes gene_type:complete
MSNKEYKYTTSFSSDLSLIDLAEVNRESFASLKELEGLIPDIDFDKNIDLIGVAFNAAVANMFNLNGDGIDGKTALEIKDQFIHKPTNIEHQRDKIVGHIVSAGLSTFGGNELIESHADGEAKPFNISLSAVIYKSVNKEFAKLIEASMDEESELYHKVSASWEIGFNEYDIAVGDERLKNCRIASEEEKEDLKASLMCYGGNGTTEEGEKVYRLIKGLIYPIGIGFTSNPAAAVKGLISKSEEDLEKTNEQKISQSLKDDVNYRNRPNLNKLMEQEILNQFKEVLETSAASKKLSEESVANITKIFHDAIVEKNEQWHEEKEALTNERTNLVEAAKKAQVEIESLQEDFSSTQSELEELKSEVSAQKALELFNNRMSDVDQLFSLKEADRVIIAEELKSVDSSDEAYSEYKTKLSTIWHHKTKAFEEEQKNLMAEQIEAGVKKKLAELSGEKPESVVSEEEATEIIEDAEVEESAVANNNGASTEDELSLKEKFAKAFSKENIEIKY